MITDDDTQRADDLDEILAELGTTLIIYGDGGVETTHIACAVDDCTSSPDAIAGTFYDAGTVRVTTSTRHLATRTLRAGDRVGIQRVVGRTTELFCIADVTRTAGDVELSLTLTPIARSR